MNLPTEMIPASTPTLSARRIPRSFRASYAVAVLAVLLATVLGACSSADPDPGSVPETILLQGRFGSRAISLEIADDPAEQAKGLMDRSTLASDHGMLFVYPDEAERIFWMHNTHISLDMIFLDTQRTVVGIIRRAKPDSDETLTVKVPSRYVLEVEAGLSDRLGIREGDRLIFR